MTKYKYPNVICEHHPDIIEPGYMICQHIFRWQDAAYVEIAGPENLGILACAQCHENSESPTYVFANFILCCAQGLRENGCLPTIN